MAIHTMTIAEDSTPVKKCFKNIWIRILLIVAAVLVVILLVALHSVLTRPRHGPSQVLEGPLLPPPPSHSPLKHFREAAIGTDSPECSIVGRDVLSENGSAVDAAIAAMFCNGLHNMQSMGIGGGAFMTVYIKSEGKAYSVVARETAPAAAHKDMYKNNKDGIAKGPTSVAVPGQLRGMWLAHQRWGLLPWKRLLQPTLEHCYAGYPMSDPLYAGLLRNPRVMNDVILRYQYYNSSANAFYPPGTIVRPHPVVCETLTAIAEHGADDMYTGTLAKDLANDLQQMGSIITLSDLQNYNAKLTEAVKVPLGDGYTLYSAPPPASGILVGYVLNILRGYNFSIDGLTNINSVRTVHRIIESFKFAYAARSELGDEDFVNINDLMKNLTSPEFAESIRQKINDTYSSNSTSYYGAKFENVNDKGTAHISVLAANGDAVSVTSSINYYFGSGVSSRTTGITLNNEMDDFSIPGVPNSFNISPSEANFIQPRKRPQSSMAPLIIVDEHQNVKVVIGASGGSKIFSTVAQILLRQLTFDESPKEAIDAPRFFHQLVPPYVEYEFGVTQSVLIGLRRRGHGRKKLKFPASVACTLYKNKSGIYANADWRKGGTVEGYPEVV